MRDEINRRIDRLGKDADDIAWEPVFWHEVIGARQNQMLEAFRDAGTEWSRGRRFALAALGDASAYTYNAERENSIYQRIHGVMFDALQRAKARLDRSDRPLVIFANSLGGIISSDYIWDRRWYEEEGSSDPHGGTKFERLHTLASFITFGCNIPLFVHGFQPLRAIQLPHPSMPANLKAKARWHNFYDDDDVLGYPLAPLGDDYEKLAEQGWLVDHEIESGPIWSKWTPDSHRHYWTDNDFTRPCAMILADLL